MLEEDYIHWQDYYKDKFTNQYEQLKKTVEKYNNDDYRDEKSILKQYIRFFNCACQLMQYYLWNSGIFCFGILECIRRFYRLEFIYDGETWVVIYNKIRKYVQDGKNGDKIIDFVINKHFDIFNDFDKQMKELLNGN